MLEHSRLADLLSGRNDPLWICSVSERARLALGCSTGAVYLSRSSAQHILSGHQDIDTFQLLLLPIAIQNGTLMREIARPRFVCSMYVLDDNRTYFVAMKIAERGHELWVSSMYRLRSRQIAQKCRSHVPL